MFDAPKRQSFPYLAFRARPPAPVKKPPRDAAGAFYLDTIIASASPAVEGIAARNAPSKVWLGKQRGQRLGKLATASVEAVAREFVSRLHVSPPDRSQPAVVDLVWVLCPRACFGCLFF